MNLKWLPNALTALRIAAAPVAGGMIWFATVPEGASAAQSQSLLIAFLIFSAASFTDWLDGYAARRLNAASAFGAKLDLWADKIIVFCVLVGMLPDSWAASITGLICLSARDLYIMRLRASRPDVSLKASNAAKAKTAIVMVGLAGMILGTALVFRDIAETAEAGSLSILITSLGLVLFGAGCLLSLYTGWQYLAAARAKPAT
ncbi:MAG: CDP-alcohol phosphatidyltransferase family protein [Pseudomonadota bacterium]